MNEDKTKFYEKVLELEPGSRLFFPLARQYYEQKQMSRARQVLSEGLQKHPDHFEARLLFAAILNQGGDQEKARKIYSEIFALLRDNQDFWENLSAILSGRDEKDLSLAAAFFARSGKNNSFTWTDVLKSGLENLGTIPENSPAQGTIFFEDHADTGRFSKSGSQTDEQDVKAGQAETAENTMAYDLEKYENEFEDPEEWADFDIDNEARTKSMADILFGQEEYAKAYDIYRELWHKSLPGKERRELERMMARSEQAMSLEDQLLDQNHAPIEDDPGTKKGYDKKEAIEFLMTLADRLEAKSA